MLLQGRWYPKSWIPKLKSKLEKQQRKRGEAKIKHPLRDKYSVKIKNLSFIILLSYLDSDPVCFIDHFHINRRINFVPGF